MRCIEPGCRATPPAVVFRAGGVSSTPRPPGSITDVSGILDRPPSRTMTPKMRHRMHQSHLHLPASRFARALPTVSPQTRGRRECRVLAAPAVPCARDGGRGAHEHTGTVGARRHSLRSGFTAYGALSPETNSSCLRHRRIDGFANPVGLAKTSTDLTPATGARTTRFCRTLQHRSSAAPPIAHRPKPALQSVSAQRALPRPPHSLPNVRDDRDTPLLAGRERARL
jgi:hypothetical protein